MHKLILQSNTDVEIVHTFNQVGKSMIIIFLSFSHPKHVNWTAWKSIVFARLSNSIIRRCIFISPKTCYSVKESILSTQTADALLRI